MYCAKAKTPVTNIQQPAKRRKGKRERTDKQDSGIAFCVFMFFAFLPLLLLLLLSSPFSPINTLSNTKRYLFLSFLLSRLSTFHTTGHHLTLAPSHTFTPLVCALLL